MAGRVNSLHACPGRCGAQITVDRYACRACWARLPKALQAPIVDAWKNRNLGDAGARQAAQTAHRAAMSEARRWFVVNPAGGPS